MANKPKSPAPEPRFKFSIIREDALPPEKSYPGDACWDIFTPVPVTLDHGSFVKVPIGLAFEFPPEFMLLVLAKSGLAQIGITTNGNVVDSGYRGEVCVTLVNLSSRTIHFQAGEKIAQFTFIRIATDELKKVEFDELSVTGRGSAGFGSSGSTQKKTIGETVEVAEAGTKEARE